MLPLGLQSESSKPSAEAEEASETLSGGGAPSERKNPSTSRCSLNFICLSLLGFVLIIALYFLGLLLASCSRSVHVHVLVL
jgi:hypothetical protein